MSNERPHQSVRSTQPSGAHGRGATTGASQPAGWTPLGDRNLPRSPAERIEPRRGPVRPRDLRERQPPRKLGPRLRAFNSFLTVLLVLLAVVALAVMAFERQVDQPGPLRSAKTVVVPEREGAQDIARRLESEGVISNAHVFVAHYLSRSALVSTTPGQKFLLKSGEYVFEPGASIREVTDAIGKGRSVTVNITIPEGLTSHAIVERLKADQNLSGEVVRVPPEGTLMPDTYRVPKGMARQAVLDMMRTEQQRFMERIWAQRQQGLPVRTPEEAIILASIVEKETGRRDERERVAAVFVNRLRKNMRLQSDPTILYGLALGQVQWGKPITRSDINSRTPHNTYVIAALPPTPICNPGRASIAATLKPAATGDLYFVADGQGGHFFSETLKDHNAAVANWRKLEKELRARQAERQAQAAAAAQQGKQQQAVEAADAEVQVPAQVLAAEGVPEEAAKQPPQQRGRPKRN